MEDADSPTYAKHRFGAIKTILRFPKKHGKWAMEADQALPYAAVPVPPEGVAMAPATVSRLDFEPHSSAAPAASRQRARATPLLAAGSASPARKMLPLFHAMSFQKTETPLASLLACCFLALLAEGCKPAPPPPAPPPMVTVSHPVERELTDWDEYPGRLAATDVVQLRARVSGFIEDSGFTEGAIIKKGDLLFTIDPRPFQAVLQQAQAQLAQAQAQQRVASSQWERIQPLQKSGAVSLNQALEARQAVEITAAAVQAAQAAIQQAQLNLDWCRVTAPITGRVGRKLVTPGNLVTGGTATGTLLTTITTLDPIYCYADVDERSVLRYQQLVRERARPSAREGNLPALLAVGSEKEFSHKGHIDFVDNQIDAGTGTITIRGVFENPDKRLIPGFYARMRIMGRGPHEAMLIPQVAIGSMLAQQFVLIVGPDGVVKYRPVKPGPTVGGLQEVDGIGPEDRVVVEGLVNARPGAHVRTREIPAEVAAGEPGPPEAAATQAVSRQPGSKQSAAPRGTGQGPSQSSNGSASDGAGSTGAQMGGGPGRGASGAAGGNGQ